MDLIKRVKSDCVLVVKDEQRNEYPQRQLDQLRSKYTMARRPPNDLAEVN